MGKGKPLQTRATVDTKPFVSPTKTDDTFRPLLRGSLIHRYLTKWNNDYWISFGDWLAEPRYSASYEAKAKIVIRQTGDSLIATLDRQQFVVRDNLYTILARSKFADLRFLLGLLNSTLLRWFYQNVINPEQGEALAQVKRSHLDALPIRTLDLAEPSEKKQHDEMVRLVEMMLSTQKQLAAATNENDRTYLQSKADGLDRQIDELTCDLYGLTSEERALVAGG